MSLATRSTTFHLAFLTSRLNKNFQHEQCRNFTPSKEFQNNTRLASSCFSGAVKLSLQFFWSAAMPSEEKTSFKKYFSQSLQTLPKSQQTKASRVSVLNPLTDFTSYQQLDMFLPVIKNLDSQPLTVDNCDNFERCQQYLPPAKPMMRPVSQKSTSPNHSTCGQRFE